MRLTDKAAKTPKMRINDPAIRQSFTGQFCAAAYMASQFAHIGKTQPADGPVKVWRRNAQGRFEQVEGPTI